VAADQVIRGLPISPRNKRAIVVASSIRRSAEICVRARAHFVLHKSLSAERTKSSFSRSRALMKRGAAGNQRFGGDVVKCDWLDKSAMTCQSSDLGRRWHGLAAAGFGAATGVVQLRSLCRKRSMRSKSETKSRGNRRAWWECGLPIFRLRRAAIKAVGWKA